jgi:NAD(P)-dependent dehydrogenase (short-subunit alcohol dehydrogenase family)
MSQGFAGRRIVIAGGAGGVGLATARRFLAGGARVACLDLDARALAALAADDRTFGASCDITDSTSVDAAMGAAAEALGGVDGLVNTAGLDLVADIEAMSDAQWDRLIAVNLTGPMKVCRAAVAHLRAAGGGTIVNVSSGAGLQPLRHRTAYSASKAGLQMFSKALAMELADSGIRVNVVCPGAVETPLLRASIDAARDEDEQLEAIRARYALARIAEPDEIAAAIAWLSSAESSYVTGAALAVDGGRTFH